MSVARGFGINGKSFYTNVAKPILVNLQFTVDSANANGFGISSLKSNGYVNNVFMHTSQTPGANNGLTNPNPGTGYALVQLKQNFNVFLGVQHCIVSTTQTSTKIDNSALTVGGLYVISTLGNATLANWQAIGLPAGVTPAVGVAFIATAVGVPGEANTSTSRVMVPKVSGVTSVEVVGTTDLSTNGNIAANAGQFLYLQFLKQALTMDSYTPAGTNSAPAFTGSALGTHSHTLNLKNAAVSDDTTTRVNAGTNLLGANTGSDITIAGGGANGGIAAISAGTPAGTVAAPTFTGTPATLTGTVTSSVVAPADNTIVTLGLWFDGSSVTVDGL